MEYTATGIREKLQWSITSLGFVPAELALVFGIVLLLVVGMIFKHRPWLGSLSVSLSLIASAVSLVFVVADSLPGDPIHLFGGLIRLDDFGGYLRILCDLGVIFTLFMMFAYRASFPRMAEYTALILTILLGAHLLVMTTNFVVAALGLELISISSYVLVGLGTDPRSSEGSFKYFVFGSVVTAVMIYGMSLLYGLTGTLDFAAVSFASAWKARSILFAVAGLFTLGGFLFKVAAVPMHLWVPDVYESSPVPVVALFSVVPKLAGLGILVKFTLAIDLTGRSPFDWQMILIVISSASILIGNFSALQQSNPKRMMAYSSIAQTGFMLVGLAAFTMAGIKLTLFYAAVYMLANYAVFVWLDYFERRDITSMANFAGMGKRAVVPALLLLIGLISLTGLPPTAGFTGKLLIFSGLWEAYETSAKMALLGLLIFGLINTVVSLFFYLKIPFYSFMKTSAELKLRPAPGIQIFGIALSLLILLLFFRPDLLMGWINKINFVL